MKQDMIVILDLGSTENTVIARQIRDLGDTARSIPMILRWRSFRLGIM